MPSIEYRSQHYTTEPGETVLNALLRQGADIPYSCRKGSCQCCVQRLLAGRCHALGTVSPVLGDDGHILPCIAIADSDLVLGPPSQQHRAIPVELVERRPLAADILEIDLAPLREIRFKPGQHVELIRDDGLSRPYSIVSLPDEDYFFRIQMRLIPGGVMSRWLGRESRLGEKLHLRGPLGNCYYGAQMRDSPLLLLATGVGAGAMLAIVRDALAHGHTAPIILYHGVACRWDLYLHDDFQQLEQSCPQFRYQPCISRDPAEDGFLGGRVTEHAFASTMPLDHHQVFLCGHPAMVAEARWRAVLAGARREHIHADAFASQYPSMPEDATKIAAIKADPELWAALDHGPGLTRILEAFYQRVFADAALAPFFQHVTMERAIQKQYEFLSDLISGTRKYFGLNPYNAHHWMVISDELFDYRENMFEQTLIEQGLRQPLIRRWMALHERLRGEIVKAVARGMISQGIEQPLQNHIIEHLEIDTRCDGCGQEIAAFQPSRYQYRSGKLHCQRCAGIPADS